MDTSCCLEGIWVLFCFFISDLHAHYFGTLVLCHPPLQNGKIRRQENNRSGTWLHLGTKPCCGGRFFPTENCFFGVGFPIQSCLGALRLSLSHHLPVPGHFSDSNKEMLKRFRRGVGSPKSQSCSACQRASETQTYWDLEGFQWQKFDFSFL